ncbi:putative flagellin with Flp1-like domain [Natranaerovirga hydrolytica]|uniref:Putative flagellin with Flp1-like domain n=1 Tax=Natranaerovirga hydrolytica TaxID=680378 RepID=A0A4R1MP65_9FIRM|nr:Flp1 family type IVb pilin [Natranaerovirga hydrolytica]TCK93104.1 putative flagellin with Flp1-like domain [Natranaerovirga hydrolytica]
MDLLKRFWYEEDGLGVVEIILIIVVLIAIVAIFQDQIGKVISNIFGRINEDVDGFPDIDYQE